MTIGLEARLGTWHPDRDTDPGVAVNAFAVAGGPLQIPGPIIRVREDTEIRVRIRNSLDDSLALHGFYPRPGHEQSSGAVMIAPGESREIGLLRDARDVLLLGCDRAQTRVSATLRA